MTTQARPIPTIDVVEFLLQAARAYGPLDLSDHAEFRAAVLMVHDHRRAECEGRAPVDYRVECGRLTARLSAVEAAARALLFALHGSAPRDGHDAAARALLARALGTTTAAPATSGAAGGLPPRDPAAAAGACEGLTM